MDFLAQFTQPIVLELVGITGFITYVLNYALLTFRVLDARDITYFVLNLLAASFVLIGLMASFNLASAMIQLFWIAISIIAISIRILGRRAVFN